MKQVWELSLWFMGVAKVSNPVKQGLVAMTGPIFDTLIICTATALMILVSEFGKHHRLKALH